jgi:hypothetical protein
VTHKTSAAGRREQWPEHHGGLRWPMRSNFQKSIFLDALFKVHKEAFLFLKMRSLPSQHMFSVIDLTSMDTTNYKNFDS